VLLTSVLCQFRVDSAEQQQQQQLQQLIVQTSSSVATGEVCFFLLIGRITQVAEILRGSASMNGQPINFD
jgi:hypothetical protein